MKIRVIASACLLGAMLSSCADTTTAVIQSLQSAFQTDAGAERKALNPNFEYLIATIEGRTVLLVLGYVERHPEGPIQVWYSAQREVLRLQNGRVVGLTGSTTEWRQVVLPPLPTWSALALRNDTVRWVRVRDVMPGYRFGVQDTLELRVSPPPIRSGLKALDPQSLTWFEERITSSSTSAANNELLPMARYAVSLRNEMETVVYGEQCVKPELCFSWQRWPAKLESAKGAH